MLSGCNHKRGNTMLAAAAASSARSAAPSPHPRGPLKAAYSTASSSGVEEEAKVATRVRVNSIGATLMVTVV